MLEGLLGSRGLVLLSGDGASRGDGTILALEVGVGRVHVGITLGSIHGVSHATAIKRGNSTVDGPDHTLGKIVLNDLSILSILIQGKCGSNRKSWDCNLI